MITPPLACSTSATCSASARPNSARSPDRGVVCHDQPPSPALARLSIHGQYRSHDWTENPAAIRNALHGVPHQKAFGPRGTPHSSFHLWISGPRLERGGLSITPTCLRAYAIAAAGP